jgi:hypothetical protein
MRSGCQMITSFMQPEFPEGIGTWNLSSSSTRRSRLTWVLYEWSPLHFSSLHHTICNGGVSLSTCIDSILPGSRMSDWKRFGNYLPIQGFFNRILLKALPCFTRFAAPQGRKKIQFEFFCSLQYYF